MLQFAANLSLLYPEHAFLDRFAAAAEDGFAGVEYLFPYAWPATSLATRLHAQGLQQVLFNAPPGDWEAGERGLACLPGREQAFRDGFAQALEYAHALACKRIHVMAGRITGVQPMPDQHAELLAQYLDNLLWAAGEAAKLGCQILIEPINQRDMPGYFLSRQDQAHHIVETLHAQGVTNVAVQMDLYHCQIVEGDVTTKLRDYLPTGRVGHIQIASVPERHEPDGGELHYPHLFAEITRLAQEVGWAGWLGCEYHPRLGAEPGGTRAGLAWLRAWRAQEQACAVSR